MKNCPSCSNPISPKAETCPNCGHPLKKKTSGCAWLFLIGVIFLVLAATLGSDLESATTSEGQALDAVYMSHTFVRRQLKSPGTADFQNGHDADVYIIEGTDNRYQVESYVDSHNSFGAQIRTHYMCDLEYLGNKEWRLLDLITK